MRVGAVVTTAPAPGAIAIVQLHGADAVALLERLTGRSPWPPGRVRLCDFAGIDTGLAVVLRTGFVQLMPHGGPRVVAALLAKLRELGALDAGEVDAATLHPEAGSGIEADVLAAIARATSPAAIDLLAAQPDRWRRALHAGETVAAGPALDGLLDAPTIVVVGRPNVGKSTLANRLMGRPVSVVADAPGTTRDWVGGLVELGTRDRAVAVRWLDTPGLRSSTDRVEQAAIELARRVVAAADVLIAMRDPGSAFPEPRDLPRPADLRVMNKCDLGGTDEPDVIRISAQKETGLAELERRVLASLGLDATPSDALWAFSDTLRKAQGDRSVDLRTYVGDS